MRFFLGPAAMCAIVVVCAYGIPWILDRLGDVPIMRKRINAGSEGWQRPRRWRPDPRKFRKIVDDPKEEEEEKTENDKGVF